MLKTIKDYFATEDASQRSSTSGQSLYFSPKYDDWSGYSDCHQLNNGLDLARNNFTHNVAKNKQDVGFVFNLGLHFIVSADYCLYSYLFKQKIAICSEQVWLCEGNLGMVDMSFPKNKSPHRFISLDFSDVLISRWAEDFRLPSWLCKTNCNVFNEIRHLIQQPKMMARVAQIIAQPTDTLSDTLTLEAMTLDLCSEFTTLEKQVKKNKIDDAIDIIKQNYHRSLTINELARCVGLNECYLKRDFKAYTGQTIAQYIRNLRMQTAMKLLLDDNKTLQEAAFYVGYRNVGYFSKAFSAYFSVSPTELTK